MAYCAADVAKYIISYCSANKSPVTNLKLQKMLYFVWIDYYTFTKAQLFAAKLPHSVKQSKPI